MDDSYTHGVATAAREKLGDIKRALGGGYKVPEQTGPLKSLPKSSATPGGYHGGAKTDKSPYRGGATTTPFSYKGAGVGGSFNHFHEDD